MSKTMKAVAKTEAAKGFEFVDAPIPKPRAGEVLVKVRVAAICGTDVHIYSWDQWAQGRIKPPLIFGHEFCGDVVELGEGVKGVKEGDFVSVESSLRCLPYTAGRDLCESVEIVGIGSGRLFRGTHCSI